MPAGHYYILYMYSRGFLFNALPDQLIGVMIITKTFANYKYNGSERIFKVANFKTSNMLFSGKEIQM